MLGHRLVISLRKDLSGLNTATAYIWLEYKPVACVCHFPYAPAHVERPGPDRSDKLGGPSSQVTGPRQTGTPRAWGSPGSKTTIIQ